MRPEIPPQNMPDKIRRHITDANWIRASGGATRANVFRLDRSDGASLFIKFGDGIEAAAITKEVERLQWLNRRISAPEVVQYEFDGVNAWLLTSALHGETAFDLMARDEGRRSFIVKLVARFLSQLHDLPLDSCPFDASVNVRLAEGRWNIDNGYVDARNFDAKRSGWTEEQIWDKLKHSNPRDERNAVTHGDFTLKNILIDQDRVSGCIDVGRLGRADIYQDISLMWRDLGRFGPAFQTQFLEAYGALHIDNKIDFYLCLDELF